MSIVKTVTLLSVAAAGTSIQIMAQDSIPANNDARYQRLTNEDYQRVANELGIEVAVIKAVSDIEAGKKHQGFTAPGQPTLNFSRSMFNSNLKRRGITVPTATRKSQPAFQPLNSRKYGSYANAQHARLQSALAIDTVAAIQSCYWGMFQIGGFNWKKCGCQSPQEFMQKMSHSELMQLELFAVFVTNCGMLKHLKNKNWYGFARLYNGKYAKRYATRMAAAYKRYK
ncbi:MAG: N-acetylmuramidase family protein [Muribaculaceae bacterium]